VLYSIRLDNEHLARLRVDLESLPNAFTTLDTAEVVNDAMDSMRSLEV